MTNKRANDRKLLEEILSWSEQGVASISGERYVLLRIGQLAHNLTRALKEEHPFLKGAEPFRHLMDYGIQDVHDGSDVGQIVSFIHDQTEAIIRHTDWGEWIADEDPMEGNSPDYVKIKIDNLIVGSNNTVTQSNPVSLYVEREQKSALSGLFSKIGKFLAKITSMIAKMLMK